MCVLDWTNWRSFSTIKWHPSLDEPAYAQRDSSALWLEIFIWSPTQLESGTILRVWVAYNHVWVAVLSTHVINWLLSCQPAQPKCNLTWSINYTIWPIKFPLVIRIKDSRLNSNIFLNVSFIIRLYVSSHINQLTIGSCLNIYIKRVFVSHSDWSMLTNTYSLTQYEYNPLTRIVMPPLKPQSEWDIHADQIKRLVWYSWNYNNLINGYKFDRRSNISNIIIFV